MIRSHYYHELGFAEIGQMLDVTKGRVSQIHRRALLVLAEARGSLGGLDSSY